MGFDEAPVIPVARPRWVGTAAAAVLMAVSFAMPSPAQEPGAPHPSIVIDGDDDFSAPWSGVRSGSGTADDPYVISDWTVVATRGFGIRIANTTSHVVVERVVVEGMQTLATFIPECLLPSLPLHACSGPGGIEVQHARNVVVRDVQLVVNPLLTFSIGLLLVDSADVDVSRVTLGVGNRLETKPTIGMVVAGSADVTVHDVAWQTALAPLASGGNERLTVRDSSFGGDNIVSVGGGSRGVTVENNLWIGTTLVLFDFESAGAAGVRIVGNRFRSENGAIEAFSSSGNGFTSLLVCGNSVAQATSPWIGAVNLRGARGVLVAGNDFDGNSIGLTAYDVAALTLDRNRFANSAGTAASLRGDELLARNNTFEGNGDGLRAYDDVDARHNWWGDASGPSGLGPGSGDAVLGPASYEPWLATPPDLAVDCAALEPPEAPPVPPALVDTHVLEGAAAARLVIDLPQEARVSVSAAYEIAPVTGVDFMLFEAEFDGSGTNTFWSAFMGAGRTVHAQAFAASGELPVGAETPPALSWFQGAFGSTSNYCCLGPGTHQWLMAGGERHGVVRSHYAVRIEASNATVAWNFTNQTDLVTLEDFDGGTRAKAEGEFLGASVARGAVKDLSLEMGLFGFSSYWGAPVDDTTYTLRGPDGPERNAKSLALLGEPAGDYVLSLEQLSAGSPGLPWFLYADLAPQT